MENSNGCTRKSKDVSLQELRDRLAEFAEVRGWVQYHSPRNLLLALVSPYYTQTIITISITFSDVCIKLCKTVCMQQV